MKLNLANPSSGLQKIVEIDDEKKLLPFFEKKIGQEVTCDNLGDEFKGYIFRISGGNDKQGFPMMQGVLVNNRVRILFKTGMKCFRARRCGQMKRKSVRGCIVGADLSVLNLVLVKAGSEHIPGLTDGEKPRRLGPKRASHIRKLFNLNKDDDVRQFVIRRKIEGKSKPKTKAPKIQRLITSSRLQRKRRIKSQKLKKVCATREAASEYKIMLDSYKKQQNDKKAHELAKKKLCEPNKKVENDAKKDKKSDAKTNAPKTDTKNASKTVDIKNPKKDQKSPVPQKQAPPAANKKQTKTKK